MSVGYDAHRVCEECGNPSPWASVCGECETAARAYREGYRAGVTSAMRVLSAVQAEFAGAVRRLEAEEEP